MKQWIVELINSVVPASKLVFLPEHVEMTIRKLIRDIDIRPLDLSLHTKIGISYLQLGNFRQAIANFQKAQSLDTSRVSHTLILLLGVTHLLRNSLDNADFCFTRYAEIKPDRHEGYFFFAITSHIRGDQKQAIAMASKAASKERRNCYSLILKAGLLGSEGKEEECLDEYEKILLDFPNHSLASAYYRQAISQFKQTSRIENNDDKFDDLDANRLRRRK